MANGTYSVMSRVLSILAYGKSIALSHSNARAVSWSDDHLTMAFRVRDIVVARFGAMVRGVIEEAESKLWEDLIWARQEERFETPHDRLQDDVTWTR